MKALYICPQTKEITYNFDFQIKFWIIKEFPNYIQRCAIDYKLSIRNKRKLHNLRLGRYVCTKIPHRPNTFDQKQKKNTLLNTKRTNSIRSVCDFISSETMCIEKNHNTIKRSHLVVSRMNLETHWFCSCFNCCNDFLCRLAWNKADLSLDMIL